MDGVTANATEINQLDGNTLTNSFTASSTTQYPSSNAISGYVLGLMDNLGGFVAIANENSFPTTNPDPSDDAGTVVSISDAGGLVVSASGTASGQTTGGTAVTITGFPSALQAAPCLQVKACKLSLLRPSTPIRTTKSLVQTLTLHN